MVAGRTGKMLRDSHTGVSTLKCILDGCLLNQSNTDATPALHDRVAPSVTQTLQCLCQELSDWLGAVPRKRPTLQFSVRVRFSSPGFSFAPFIRPCRDGRTVNVENRYRKPCFLLKHRPQWHATSLGC